MMVWICGVKEVGWWSKIIPVFWHVNCMPGPTLRNGNRFGRGIHESSVGCIELRWLGL